MLKVKASTTRPSLLQEIRRVVEEIAPERLTIKKFNQKSRFSERKVSYHFGTFNAAVEAAALVPNPPCVPASSRRKYTDEELLREIGELWKREGCRPTEVSMNAKGRYSGHPYITR